ncbi:MAG TPA: lipopolysaccharide biosynthesis protein [Candidatus Sulfotelmatobacter sp.]|nr:lipopolysaccharide biosynthesis protein [Candidatus Sulfotelmatobacter sp.]
MKPFDAKGEFCPVNKVDGLRRVVVRSAGITLLGQGASFFVQIGSTMVLARILTPNDFGVVTMVTTFSLLFRSFGLNGFTELIMQREGLTHSLASNLFWMQLGIGTLLTLAFAGSAPLLGMFYHNAAVVRIAEGMSLTICIGCLGWIHLGLLQRAMQFKITAIINFAGQFALVVVSIILAVMGWHYWALVWGSVVQVAVVAVAAWLACKWIPSFPRRDTAGTGSGLKFAANVYCHFAFSYLTSNTDNLLVGWRYGAQPLGFYKKAYDLFVLPQTQLMSPISAVAVSTLSRVSGDRERFRRYFLEIISVLALVGMGIGTDFALVGKDIIRVLLGPGWDEAGRIFSLFGPGIGVMLLYSTHGWIHLSIGRPERWLRWGLLGFVCTTSLFFVGLHWGPSGVALAWTVAYFLLMFPGFWYAGKPIGLGLAPLLGAVWKFFVASVVAGTITLLILRAFPFFGATASAPAAFLRMLLVSVVFLALYLGALTILYKGTKPLNEAALLFRDLLPEELLRRFSSAQFKSRNAVTTEEI